MAFDYKREYREFYMPKDKPSIVNVPRMNYIAVRATPTMKMASISNRSISCTA